MLRTVLTLSLLLPSPPAWAETAAPVAAHDYAHAAAASAAEQSESRFLVLEGGRNFRDVGGYRTADGHTVKRGVMYRSGSLGSLTAEGQAKLARLGVARIIDLRTTEERSNDTADLRATFGDRYWTRDYRMSLGDMRSHFSDPASLTAAGMRTMMTGAYRTMAQEQVPGYRAMFAELVAGKAPLVVNCTAGKDRTGIATALVLTAIGVPYATVRQDFLLSNGAPGMETLHPAIAGPLAKLPPDVAAPLIGVDGEYLDTAFAQLRADYGSIEGFLEKELAVGPEQVAVLKARLLD